MNGELDLVEKLLENLNILVLFSTFTVAAVGVYFVFAALSKLLGD